MTSQTPILHLLKPLPLPASEPVLSGVERSVFYQSDRPTKNALEKKWIQSSREKTGNASDLENSPENIRSNEMTSISR